MTQEHAVLMVAIFAAPGILAFYIDGLKQALRNRTSGASVAPQTPAPGERDTV